MMLSSDIIKEILLRADINVIKNFPQKWCNILDKKFWQQKFAYHNFYFPVVRSMEYIELFKWLTELMDKVKIVLKINKLEATLDHNKTDGLIIVRIEHIDPTNLDDILESKLPRDGDLWYYNNIEFHLTKEGYLIKLTHYHSDEEIERIFCYCLTATAICYDNNIVNFFSMEDMAFDENELVEIHYPRPDQRVIACQRYGIWLGYLLAIKYM